jgi:hypothetical protein
MLLMTRKQQPRQTAAATYAERHAEANELLKRIANQLERHASQQASSPENWGHAGELGSVTEELARILATLGDRSAVDAKGLNY